MAEDKAAIGKPSSPRWELDVVADDVRDNVIHVIDCKSDFDNAGVGARWLKDDRPASRAEFLKLFADDTSQSSSDGVPPEIETQNSNRALRTISASASHIA